MVIEVFVLSVDVERFDHFNDGFFVLELGFWVLALKDEGADGVV